MASYMEQTAAKLEFQLEEFEVNAKFMLQEMEEECRNVLMAGAAAWATVAQRHTPPSLGQQDITPSFYNSVELDYVPDKGTRLGGMRMWFNLRKAIKNPQTHRWKKMFGAWLREGYEYAVVIKSKAKQRKGRWMYIKPLHTRSQVQGYAIEDYRGLMRAGWGLGFLSMTGKMPPVFNKYLQRRPVLQRMQGYCGVVADMDEMSISVINGFVDGTQGFMPGLQISSDLAAVSAMNREMRKFFEKKWNL